MKSSDRALKRRASSNNDAVSTTMSCLKKEKYFCAWRKELDLFQILTCVKTVSRAIVFSTRLKTEFFLIMTLRSCPFEF